MLYRNFEASLKWRQDYSIDEWIEQILLTLGSLSDELHPFRKYYLDFFTEKAIYEKKKLDDSVKYLSGNSDRWIDLQKDHDRSDRYRTMLLDHYCSIDRKYRGIGFKDTLIKWEQENYQYVQKQEQQNPSQSEEH